MKTRTAEASLGLNLHPAEFLQRVVSLEPELTFAEVWPEIDEQWVETVSALDLSGVSHRAAENVRKTGSALLPRWHGLSDHAVDVLNKLYRKRKFGAVSVRFDSLKNLTHLPERDLSQAVAELRNKELLHRKGVGKRPTISLNSAKKVEIESILQLKVNREKGE